MPQVRNEITSPSVLVYSIFFKSMGLPFQKGNTLRVIPFFSVTVFTGGSSVFFLQETTLKSAVAEIRNLKNTHKIVECVIKINSIENQADEIFDASIEKLFDSDVDAKELIKRREIYQVLEIITDKCEDAGNVIESIVVKYA
jgi:hypothetical protein